MSAWLGGQLLLGAIIGSSSAIALWLLGVPFFYVLALISGVGELIPVVGPILAAIPAVLVASTVSLNKAILVIVFFVIQQQLENHILVPKIMARQVGVSAVTVIVALLIGGKLLGIPGRHPGGPERRHHPGALQRDSPRSTTPPDVLPPLTLLPLIHSFSRQESWHLH